MNKINFENGKPPYLNAENLNLMQDNMESAGVPAGGFKSQILSKKSDEDNDVEWIDNTGGVTGDTLPIGSMVDYDGDTPPTNWEEVIDTDIYYVSGNTFTIRNLACAGHISSSSEQVIFNIPTEKNMKNITTITLTSLKVNARHSDGGYVIGYVAGGQEISTWNITTSKSYNNSIRVVVNLPEKSTFANNCPVTVDIQSGTISFR